MEVNFEELIQRSNHIGNYISGEIAQLSEGVINSKESEDKWSILEVLSHLNQVYERYAPNFDKALKDARPLTNETDSRRQTTLMGRLSIYSMKPKGKSRKFKMKTFRFFEPISSSNLPDETISRYLKNKENFTERIKKARLLDIKNIKVPTALGKSVKFYLPECFDFILSHEERHMVQIEGILEKIGQTSEV
ncbi:MAG: DinB family protein [Cyclobacteriaceae bacterium]